MGMVRNDRDVGRITPRHRSRSRRPRREPTRPNRVDTDSKGDWLVTPFRTDEAGPPDRLFIEQVRQALAAHGKAGGLHTLSTALCPYLVKNLSGCDDARAPAGAQREVGQARHSASIA